MRPSRKRPPTGRTAIGELTAHLRAAKRTRENKLVAQYAISELDEKPMAVASASVGTTDRAVPSGVGSCAFSGPWHVRDAG